MQNTFTWMYAFFLVTKKNIINDLMESHVNAILLVFDHERVFIIKLTGVVITDQKLVIILIITFAQHIFSDPLGG